MKFNPRNWAAVIIGTPFIAPPGRLVVRSNRQTVMRVNVSGGVEVPYSTGPVHDVEFSEEMNVCIEDVTNSPAGTPATYAVKFPKEQPVET